MSISQLGLCIAKSKFNPPKTKMSISQLGLCISKSIYRAIFLDFPSIAFFPSKLCQLVTTILRYGRLTRGGSRPPLPPRRCKDSEDVLKLQSDIEILFTTLGERLGTNGFIEESDFMTVPWLTTPEIEQDTYKENVSILWQLLFPGKWRLTISETDEGTIRALADYARRGNPTARKLPPGMWDHRKDDDRYRKSINKLWELELGPADRKSQILALYPKHAPRFGTLLEVWIGKATEEDIPAIAKTLSSLVNQYGSIESLEFMSITRLGNLIASLIRICGYNSQSVESTFDFIDSMLNLVGRHKMNIIFQSVVRRLEKDGIILSLYLFYQNIPQPTSQWEIQKSQDSILDLVEAVDGELRKIDNADLAPLDTLGIGFLRLCMHITLYLSLHADYWEHDIFFFYRLTTITEQVVGSINRQLWCCIRQESLYDWATSNLQGLLANPANTVASDAVFSQEALDRIVSTSMEQYPPQSNAPGPASLEAIASLPKNNLDEKMLGPELEAECSVCMDDVTVGDVVVVLPCTHWFHEACATAWLNEHNSCPICRLGLRFHCQNGSPPAPGNDVRTPVIPANLVAWFRTSNIKLPGEVKDDY